MLIENNAVCYCYNSLSACALSTQVVLQPGLRKHAESPGPDEVCDRRHVACCLCCRVLSVGSRLLRRVEERAGPRWLVNNKRVAGRPSSDQPSAFKAALGVYHRPRSSVLVWWEKNVQLTVRIVQPHLEAVNSEQTSAVCSPWSRKRPRERDLPPPKITACRALRERAARLSTERLTNCLLGTFPTTTATRSCPCRRSTPHNLNMQSVHSHCFWERTVATVRLCTQSSTVCFLWR